jgi:hypothetical protein
MRLRILYLERLSDMRHLTAETVLQTRLKRLFVATLAFAFLLLLLLTNHELAQKLIHLFCHRTGKKLKQTKVPLYRLRSALSRLWLSYPPNFTKVL